MFGQNQPTSDNLEAPEAEPVGNKTNPLTTFPSLNEPDSTGSKLADEPIKGYDDEFSLDPLQRAQRNYFAQKAGLFRILKWISYVFIAGLLGGLTLAISLYLNKINSISVPIGLLQGQVQDLKDSNKDSNTTIQNLNAQIVQLQIQQAKLGVQNNPYKFWFVVSSGI